MLSRALCINIILHETKFGIQFLHTFSIEILIVEVEGSQYQIEHDDVDDESAQYVVECCEPAGLIGFHH
jgi:hypothetical protein